LFEKTTVTEAVAELVQVFAEGMQAVIVVEPVGGGVSGGVYAPLTSIVP
jgi:hypothetical protein